MKTMSSSKFLTKYSWILLIPALLIFQNCKVAGITNDGDSIQPSTTKVVETSSGGGDGYDGKLFLNRIVDAALCPDGTNVRSIVKIKDDGTAELLRDNCQDQTPSPLANDRFDYMPHNVDNLIFDAKAFDVDAKISKDPRVSTYVCRANELIEYYRIFHRVNLPDSFGDRWGDLIVKPTQTGQSARFKAALYEKNSRTKMMSKIFDSGEFAVGIESGIGPMVIFGTMPGGMYFSVMMAGPRADGSYVGKWIYDPKDKTVPPGMEGLPAFNMNITCYAQ